MGSIGVGVALGALALAPSASAGVNTKNGNFYISYTDIAFAGLDDAFEIDRTYNSKSTEIGAFGFGWGSLPDTRLVAHLDGSVTVSWNGSGSTAYFYAMGNRERAIAEAVERIVAAEIVTKAISAEGAAARRASLREDAETRNRAYLRVRVQAGSPSFPVGTRLFETGGGHDVTRTVDGWVVNRGESSHVFDHDGHLVRLATSKGWIRFERDVDGRLLRSADHRGNLLTYEHRSGDQVTAMVSEGRVRARFVYEGTNLVRSVDQAGNEYGYTYDWNHNLVQVSYKDGSSTRIVYSGEQFAEAVIDPDSARVEYRYFSLPPDPAKNYGTLLRKFDAQGVEETSKRQRDEFHTDSKGGPQVTLRHVSTRGTRTVDTRNDAHCGRPIERIVSVGGRVETTSATYDGACRVTTTSRGGRRTTYAYDPQGKVVEVRRGASESYRFSYDAKGQLTRFDGSDGGNLRLEYDAEGRIVRVALVESGEPPRELVMEYDRGAKEASRVRIPGVGVVMNRGKDGQLAAVGPSRHVAVAAHVFSRIARNTALATPEGI